MTHFDENGQARMVNVTDKEITHRTAEAKGRIYMQKETLALIYEGRAKKGDVLGVSQVAGIMAAKKCASLIPMCHVIPLTGVSVTFTKNETDNYIEITARVTADWKTGVEMEALTAVTTAALTIYDMCKAADRGMHLEHIRVTDKTGGKSGHFMQL